MVQVPWAVVWAGNAANRRTSLLGVPLQNPPLHSTVLCAPRDETAPPASLLPLSADGSDDERERKTASLLARREGARAYARALVYKRAERGKMSYYTFLFIRVRKILQRCYHGIV